MNKVLFIDQLPSLLTALPPLQMPLQAMSPPADCGFCCFSNKWILLIVAIAVTICCDGTNAISHRCFYNGCRLQLTRRYHSLSQSPLPFTALAPFPTDVYNHRRHRSIIVSFTKDIVRCRSLQMLPHLLLLNPPDDCCLFDIFVLAPVPCLL